MLKLHKLNRLAPTLDSTVLKIVEEAGELARAVLQFEQAHTALDKRRLLEEVVSELLDVAQTCVTMLFVFEDFYDVDIARVLQQHLTKLVDKGYAYDADTEYFLTTEGSYKYLCLPRLNIKAGITRTLLKIQEELGELTQYLGKMGGASGEKNRLKHHEIIAGAAAELCDVAQCCFTMLYILNSEHDISIPMALDKHVRKLANKGYTT